MISRLTNSTTVVLTMGLLAGRAGADVADGDVKAFVDQRVQAWQPTAQERRFDEIGWAPSIREAERLARAHDRPVFLFTHDGHMAIGRC